MPNIVSPGVYTIEQDVSDYIGAVNSSVVGIVGFAARGPINKATLVTQPNDLVAKFGQPSEDIYGQGLEGALTVMSPGGTNSLYFVRAATNDVLEASAIINIGGCPAVAIKEEGYGVSKELYLRIQATGPDGQKAFVEDEGKIFYIPIGIASKQGDAIASILPGSLLSDRVAAYSDNTAYNLSEDRGIIAGLWAGSGAFLEVTASEDPSFAAESLLQVVAPIDSTGDVSNIGAAITIATDMCEESVTLWGSQFAPTKLLGGNAGAKNFGYAVESKWPGAGYNLGITGDGSTSGVSVVSQTTGNQGVSLTVFDRGTNTVSYPVSLVQGSFVEDVIGIGSADEGDPIIKGSLMYEGVRVGLAPLAHFMEKVTDMGFTDGETLNGVAGTTDTPPAATITGITPRFAKFVEGNAGLQHGSNGADSANTAGIQAALIGDAAAVPKSGIQALNNDALNISIGMVPGVSIPAVQDNLIQLAEGSQNFIALVAPPYGLNTVQDAIDWSNGQSTTRGTAINSSFAAAYWPWVQSTVQGTTRWLDPVVYAAYSMCYTDGVSEPWFAPAGQNRGSINNAQAVETDLNQGDRDSMYSGGNVLNPIVSFGIAGGVQVFGQRTAQRKTSALDRVNIRRLMIFIRKAILGSTRQYVFEPNDAFTWGRIVNVLNPFLGDIKRRRGITEFRVVCDETTNTPARVDRNEMWCKILIKPTKTAEMIVFELNLTNQSATLS